VSGNVVVATLANAVVDLVSAVEAAVSKIGSGISAVVVAANATPEARRSHMYWPQLWKTHFLVSSHPQQDFSQWRLSNKRSQ